MSMDARKKGRPAKGVNYIHEFSCRGCGEIKTWTFATIEDFERHIPAQNCICARCFIGDLVPSSEIISDPSKLPLIPWPEGLEHI